MQVLIINSEYPPVGGGAANASANLARNLADLGHDVTLLTARFANLPQQEWIESTTGSKYLVRRIPALRRREDRSGALEQIVFMLAASLAGLEVVRRFKPQIQIAFFGVPCGVASLFLSAVYRVPYIVSLRGGDVPGFRPYDFALYHRLIGPLLRIVWHKASAVVANSQGLRDLAHAFDASQEIDVISNGVDTEFYSPGVDLHRRQPASIVFAGRVVYQKGLDVLLDALANLKHLEWNLTIIGDGSQKEPLQAKAKTLGLTDRVNFTGWLDKVQLCQHYREANLFAFPSRHEGMPNVVLEAMACGLPVIATRIAGSEEIVEDGVSGLLVPPEDNVALTGALRTLITDPEKRGQMGLAANQRVQQYFTWMQTAMRYESLLREAIEK